MTSNTINIYNINPGKSTICLFGVHECLFLKKNVIDKRTGCLSLIVIRMSCYCEYPVALPQGAVGWSAVCDCGIC